MLIEDNVNKLEVTMTHLEISDIAKKRSDSVKRTVEKLVEQGVIELPQIVEVPKTEGDRVVMRKAFAINKRDSHVVMAQVNPVYAAELVDRWEELENGAIGSNVLPDSFICGDSSLIVDYGLKTISGLPDFNARNQTYHLSDDFVLKKFTISAKNGGSTYMKVPAWIMDYASRGVRNMILVTNADNPHVNSIKFYVENLIRMANGTMRICLITDEFATVGLIENKKRQMALLT